MLEAFEGQGQKVTLGTFRRIYIGVRSWEKGFGVRHICERLLAGEGLECKGLEEALIGERSLNNFQEQRNEIGVRVWRGFWTRGFPGAEAVLGRELR